MRPTQMEGRIPAKRRRVRMLADILERDNSRALERYARAADYGVYPRLPPRPLAEPLYGWLPDRNEMNKSCQGFCPAHNNFGVFVPVVPAFFLVFVMRKLA